MVTRYKDPNMQDVIKKYIRSAMDSQDLTYRELSLRLARAGVSQTESTLRTKVTTGMMTSSLFIHILHALNVKRLELDQIMDNYASAQNLNEREN